MTHEYDFDFKNVLFASGFLPAGGDGAKWSWQPEGKQQPAAPEWFT